MRIVEHYIELRLKYLEVDNHRTIEASLKELSDILFCSPRNVKRIMNALDEEGLLYWKPGGGRGRRSKFQFKRSLWDVFSLNFNHLVRRGKFKEAIRSIKRDGIPVELRQHCYKHLMMELSLPSVRLDGNDGNPDTRNLSDLVPVMVATITGKWMLVDRGNQGVSGHSSVTDEW